ncbi:MAG: hypothetical protein JNL61_09800 [Rhizobiaceae bacterium]|nr:hypothetical protein [Rhizobiaceae bacterium]
MARFIQLILSNIPTITFILAIVIALRPHAGRPLSLRLLNWMLLLAVGVSYVWSGVFHVFFPNVAASSIGWANSPFQYEIGVADIAIGVVAIASFWRGFEFKAAVVIYIALFSLGVAIGHVYQMVTAHDYAANNFGVLLVITIAQMVLLPVLLWLAAKGEDASSRHAPQSPQRFTPT